MSNIEPLKLSDLPSPTERIILSSAFSNRMLIDDSLVIKKDIRVEDAKSLVALAERSSNIDFLNAINPEHQSTAVLAQGLTDSPCVGGFVSLSETDVVVVMQPKKASRNATEFLVENFNQCKFELLQRLPMNMLKET